MILTFADWKLSTQRGASLGHQYDNLTSELIVQGDLPEGWEWDILVSAGGNGDTWHLTLGDGQASITLTEDNLSVSGEYYLQLRGIKGEQVRHTNIVTAYNFRSLSGAGQWPTLPTEWIQAEKDVKELYAHPPVPGEDGYWQLWDLTTHSYQPSQLVVPGLSIQAGTVTTLEPDQPATVQVVGDGPDYRVNFGIPQGKPGKDGAPGKDGTPGKNGTDGAPGQDGQTPTIAVGTVTTLDPGQDATAEITGKTPNLVLSLGIPQGRPGQDGVQLNDNAVNATEAWSSKKIVDTLCPAFSVSGNPVTCNPVEDYPLSAVVTLKPKQAGSGDPSPDNVRAISGYDGVTVNVRGKNLLSDENFQSSEKNGITFTKMGNGVVHIEGTATASADSVIVYDVPQLPPGTYYGISSYLNVVVKKASTGSNKWYSAFTGVRIEVGDVVQYYYFSVQADTTVNGSFYIFLAPGESAFSASDLEPYQPGTTATLTLPETIYGGTVDEVTGVGSEEWKLITLTGNESSYIFAQYFYLSGFSLEREIAEGICSHYPFGVYEPKSIGISKYGDAVIYAPDGDYTVDQVGLDSWRSYLAAQASAGTPVQVAYKLATPEPFQATGNQALPAVAGLNTVYTDGNSLAVSGRQDLLYTLQNMQAQTQNLNRFIAEGGTQ